MPFCAVMMKADAVRKADYIITKVKLSRLGTGGLTMDKLKLCPFCGATARLKFGYQHTQAYVECEVCEARSMIINQSVKYCAIDEAVKAWNRRANDD